MDKTIKLMVVDDSALMRRHLNELFSKEGDFEVKLARNGSEALTFVRQWQPDVITLDINMPEMDGLTALSMLMLERPTPVVMVSSLTEKGAIASFEALALGATDFVAKPGGTISLSLKSVERELLQKVRIAACARVQKPSFSARTDAPRHAARSHGALNSHSEAVGVPVAHARRPVITVSPSDSIHTNKQHPFGVVLIGVSTGGPKALEDILPALPANFPWPVLVAQHMPPNFTKAFAQRLNGICALEVCEVDRPMEIQRGHVYIARGGTDMVVSERLGKLNVLPKPESPDHLWHPSVEVLVQSALKNIQAHQLLGVMLTGMGHDGAHSMAQIKHAGGRTIAQSEDSCAVFGMPNELIKRHGASVVLPAPNIARQLQLWLIKEQ